MNKLLQKVAKIFLGLSMAAGVGVAVTSNSKEASRVHAAADTYVTMGSGSGSNNVNTWYIDSNKVTVTQNKGSGSSNPNASYVSGTNTRFYVGNVMAFVAATGYKVTGVKFTNSTSSSYYGGTYHANTSWTSSTSNITADDTTNLTLTNCASTTSGSTSTIESKSASGVAAIYIGTTKQSRPSKIEVKYTSSTTSYTTTVNVTGGALSVNNTSTSFTSALTYGYVYLTPDDDHVIPDNPASSFSVTNATLSSAYDNQDGDVALYLTSVSGNITVSGAFDEKQGTYYSVSYTGSNGSLSSTSDVAEGDVLDIYLQPATHYHLPTSITLTMGGVTQTAGTDYDYDNGTGEIQILEVTGNVVISTSCVEDAKYTVTYVKGDHGTGNDYVVSNQYAGSYTLATFATAGFGVDSGYAFKKWSVGGVEYAEGASITLSANTTVTALYSEVTAYTLVTDASDLVEGTQFILLHASTNSIAIGGWSSSYFTTVSTASVNGSQAVCDDAMVFTLEGSSGAWNVKCGDYYYGLQNSTTALRAASASGDNYSWTISITDGIASMKTAGSSTRSLCYNSGANPTRYSAYTASSSYTEVRMFAIIPESTDTTTALSISACSDAHYSSQNSTWTGYDSYTLDVSSFTISCTTTKSTPAEGYSFKGIGYMDGDNFVARLANFSSGHPTAADTRLCWQATYPTTAGGSTYLSLYVILSVTADSVSSLAITGSMTKTSYTQNEAWDPTGFTVNAYYASASSTPVDVTSDANLSWSYSPETTASTSTTSVVATASFGGQTASSSSQSVTISAPSYTNTTNLTPGDYYIAYNDSGTKHYISSVSGGKGATTTTKADGLVFTFSLVGNDTWEIKNGDNYLGVGSGSTTLTLTSTQTTLAISWETEASGTRVIKGSSGRDLAWYSSNSDIRTYSGKTDGTNGMTLEVAKTVSSFSVYSTGANKNVLKGSTFNAAAATAAGFEARLNYTDSTYDVVTNDATWSLDTSTTGTATLTVSYLEYTPVTFTDMNIYVVVITSLTVDASSAKTTYVDGETLVLTGLSITGHDSSANDYTLEIEDCTFSPASGATLSTSNTSVTVTYTNENSTTAQTSYSITVSAFVGYTKVTSSEGLVVGESYVVGVENDTKGKELMSDVSGSGTSVYRTRVDGSAAFDDEKTRVSQSEASTAGSVVVTLLSDGNGKYAFYDISNDKYIAGNSSSNYAADYDSLSAAGDNAWWTIEFADGLMSMTLNNSTRVFGYNLSSPRFSTYASYAANSTTATSGTAHPVLFKMTGSTVKTAVTSFANTSLKMNDPAYEGDIETPNCASNYSAMKSAYTALSDAEKNVFQYSDDYSAARARMLNWAKANGETFTYGAESPFATARYNVLPIIGDQNTNTVAIIVIISIVSVTAIGGYFFLRRRKENI